ncbi:L-threonylcarbamoyladenylate synthase [Pontibacter sp. JAM-7]|uniref:L-threonylcarbamoyladenylate synthase n=1 Tax=Pontibacter sp. JAM-7 TaxID=3366581 RepID=UPI003AF72B8A
MKSKPLPAGWWQVHQSVRALRQGGVIAYPTEAVWGVGCDPYNASAVAQLLAMKRRPEAKGLVLVAACIAQVEPLLQGLSSAQRAQLSATWPGPYTWVIPDPDNQIPSWIRGNSRSVAVRVSAHPVVQTLCQQFGGLLVSTSANPASHAPAKDALRVRTYFGDQLAAVVPGDLGDLAQPTQIRDLTTGQLLRA